MSHVDCKQRPLDALTVSVCLSVCVCVCGLTLKQYLVLALNERTVTLPPAALIISNDDDDDDDLLMSSDSRQ